MLNVAGLTVRLSGRRQRDRSDAVLGGVSLRVDAGECLAVVGESGAGKSVLARTLLGLTQADPRWRVEADELRVAGTNATTISQRRWRSLRGSAVALVLQDALQSLDPLRTIEAEVGEALAVRGIGRAERRRAVVSALGAAGLPAAATRLQQRSAEFSGGMRQRALIASALVGDPGLLIADEPTTALDPGTADRVLRLFGEIRSRGTGILLISHDLDAVSRVADRIAVLEHGRIVETGPSAELLANPRHPATRALIAAIPRGAKPTPPADPGAPELLRAHRIVRLFPALGPRARSAQPDAAHPEAAGVRGVDLVLRRGESVGIVGESGAGKSTLARLLVGADRPDSGAIESADPTIRVRLIPQDPYGTFDPRWRVERILAASTRPSSGEAAAAPAELLERVGLSPDLLQRRPATLSGGQRQRVAIARALASDPDVLVCDEPVSALDVATQAGILDLLRELQQRRGLAIVFVSHDLAAVRTVCDRLLVMRHGRVFAEGPTEQIFGDPELLSTIGLGAGTDS